jgi:hypothetical protein
MNSHLSSGTLVERPAKDGREAARAFIHHIQPSLLSPEDTNVVLEYLPSHKRTTMTLERALELFPPQG